MEVLAAKKYLNQNKLIKIWLQMRWFLEISLSRNINNDGFRMQIFPKRRFFASFVKFNSF